MKKQNINSLSMLAKAILVTVLVIVAACGGKIIGCSTAAKFSCMKWRESLTVGFLMNTKG